MPSLMQFNNFLLRNAREMKNVTGNSLRNASSLLRSETDNSLRNARETKNVIGNSLRNGSRTVRTWQL